MPKQVHNALTPMRVKAERKPGRYADGHGLYLHVAETGARWWVWRGTLNGKRIERGIGSALLVTLAEARDIAWQWRRWAKSGLDPAAERDKDKIQSVTFEEAARTVWQAQVVGHSTSDKYTRQWLSGLECFAFPLVGARPVHTIGQADILRVLAPIWTAKPVTARRIRQRIATIMDWARAAGHFQGVNPVEGVEKGLARQRNSVQHFAALPYQWVPALMSRLVETEGIAALAMRFLILTAARSGEVRGAVWTEIDAEARLWAIPAERMKAGREHRVPLSEPALAVLDQVQGLDDTLVFPSARRGRLMSDSTPGVLLRQLGVSATTHGMRSAFRDWCEECATFPHEVKEAALAHTVRDKVEAAYRRTDLFDKRRALMEQWGRFCMSAGASGKVVEMRA